MAAMADAAEERILAAIASSEQKTNARLAAIEDAIRGDINGRRGILERVDLLERAETSRNRVTCAAVAAVLAAIGNTIWAIITRQH